MQCAQREAGPWLQTPLRVRIGKTPVRRPMKQSCKSSDRIFPLSR